MQRRSELAGPGLRRIFSQGQFSGEARVAIAVEPDDFPAEHDAVGMDRAAEPAGDHGDPTPLPRQDQRQRLSNFAVRDAAFVANVEAGQAVGCQIGLQNAANLLFPSIGVFSFTYR